MNVERAIEHLKDYRVRSRRFDQAVEVVMSNKLAARVVRASVSAATSASRSQEIAPRPGRYDSVFFIAGEMRSGTSWLRRTLSSHPEIACGHEGSSFGRASAREEIPVSPAPVSRLTR